jgi:hypothetical protein
MITRYRGDTQPLVFKLSIKKADDTIEYLENVTNVYFSYIKTRDPVVVEGVITDAATGLVRFDILPTTFDVARTSVYDVQATFSDGTVRTFIKDNIRIIDDINKN